MSDCACLVNHMRATPPWTCPCKCHDEKDNAESATTEPYAKLEALRDSWRKQGEPSEYHDGPNCDKALVMVYHECADELDDAIAELRAGEGKR